MLHPLWQVAPAIRTFVTLTPMPAPMRWISDFDYEGVTFACGAHVRRIPGEWIEQSTSSQILDETERLLQDIRYTIATYEY